MPKKWFLTPTMPPQAISRQDLLNRADGFIIDRWSDGLIKKIDCYQKNTIIHTSTANYQVDGLGFQRLKDVTGFLYDEISEDYAETNQEINIGLIGDRNVSRLQGRVSNPATNHIERWGFLTHATAKDQFFDLYTGRGYPDSPIYQSDVPKDYEKWNMPAWLPDAQNISEGVGWRNAIDMTNCVGGAYQNSLGKGVLDQIYIEPKMAFKPPCIMRITPYLPDVSTLAAGTELIFGFEVNSQGGAAIYAVFFEQNKCWLRSKCITPTGLDQQALDITASLPAASKNSWQTGFWLYYDPPTLTLFEADNINAFSVMGTVTIGTSPDAYDYVSGFIANESSSIVSGYAVGHWAIFPRLKAYTPTVATGTGQILS